MRPLLSLPRSPLAPSPPGPSLSPSPCFWPAAAAADLKSKGHEGVLAKLDATADDAGEIDGVAGYPTMLLYRGGKKVSHDGRRCCGWPAAGLRMRVCCLAGG